VVTSLDNLITPSNIRVTTGKSLPETISNSSSAFNFTQAVYDLEIVSGSDFPVVTRILEGVIKLSKEVTTVS
jgi:hypothetical protein